jgi:hypothetical protein
VAAVQASRPDAAAIAATIARETWARLTDQERNLVRYGLFPSRHMSEAETLLLRQVATRDGPRLLAVALMDCAKADGGMRA